MKGCPVAQEGSLRNRLLLRSRSCCMPLCRFPDAVQLPGIELWAEAESVLGNYCRQFTIFRAFLPVRDSEVQPPASHETG